MTGMIHEARVSDRKSAGGDDATDWSLIIGDIVTVVGFVGDRSDLSAVVVVDGVYIVCPYWLLSPIVPVPA